MLDLIALAITKRDKYHRLTFAGTRSGDKVCAAPRFRRLRLPTVEAEDRGADAAVVKLGELRASPRHAEPLLRGLRSPLANGTDLRSLPLTERRRQLLAILPNRSRLVSKAISVVGRGPDLSSADAVSGSRSRTAAEAMRLGALRCCLSTRF